MIYLFLISQVKAFGYFRIGLWDYHLKNNVQNKNVITYAIDALNSEFNYKSRDYCFIIMSYKPNNSRPDYEQLCSLIEEHTKLKCIRANRSKKPVGICMLGKVHEMILNSSIVVADVTEYSPMCITSTDTQVRMIETPESEIKR
jgi:hypothetical protein